MGNTCCTGGNKAIDAKGSLGVVMNEGDAVYKVPGYVSRVTPAAFAHIPANEKDIILAEAFRALLTTVEVDKVRSSNPYIRQFTSKIVGKCINQRGDQYEGDIVEGAANGKGRIVYKDGRIYEGLMFNGFEHGQGKITNPANGGSVSIGDFYLGNPVGISSSKLGVNGETCLGAFDEQGKEKGLFVVNHNDGSTEYFNKTNGTKDGIQITINKTRNEIVLMNNRNGKFDGQPRIYAVEAGQQGAIPATSTAPGFVGVPYSGPYPQQSKPASFQPGPSQGNPAPFPPQGAPVLAAGQPAYRTN